MSAGHIVFEQLGILPFYSFFFQIEATKCAKANFLFLINFLILLICQETKPMTVATLT